MPAIIFGELDKVEETLQKAFFIDGYFENIENRLRIVLNLKETHKNLDSNTLESLYHDIWVKFDKTFKRETTIDITKYFAVEVIDGEFKEFTLRPIKNDSTTLYLKELIKFKIFINMANSKDIAEYEQQFLTHLRMDNARAPSQSRGSRRNNSMNNSIASLRNNSTSSLISNRSIDLNKNISNSRQSNDKSVKSNSSRQSRGRKRKKLRYSDSETETEDDLSEDGSGDERYIVRKVAKSSVPSTLIRRFNQLLPDIDEVYQNLNQVYVYLFTSNATLGEFIQKMNQIKEKMDRYGGYPDKMSNINLNFNDADNILPQLKNAVAENGTKQNVFDYYKYLLLYGQNIKLKK
jgi:hypothetical protein